MVWGMWVVMLIWEYLLEVYGGVGVYVIELVVYLCWLCVVDVYCMGVFCLGVFVYWFDLRLGSVNVVLFILFVDLVMVNVVSVVIVVYLYIWYIVLVGYLVVIFYDILYVLIVYLFELLWLWKKE